MSDHKTIKARYESDAAKRDSILETARLCAKLTKPWILPPLGQTQDQRLTENYQSVGSRGIVTLEGRMLIALWPQETPWFQLSLSAELLYGNTLSEEEKNEFQGRLALHEFIIQSTLGSSDIASTDERRPSIFQSRKRMALAQILVTGDTLEYMDEHYKLRGYRRDQYVTFRNSSGEVIYHIIHEEIDPLTLTPEQREKAQFDDGIIEKRVDERMVDIHTMIEYQPVARNWQIRQEINEHEINISQESITPYFSTPFELVEGSHYGRSFVEQNLGDLRSLNSSRQSELEIIALMAKITPVIDPSSHIRAEDLAKPSGEAIIDDVRAGVIQHIALLQSEKIGEFAAVTQKGDRLEAKLEQAFLIPDTRESERTTAFEVQKDIIEINQALGGVYAPIADAQQLPLLRRTIHQLKIDKLLPPLPEGTVEIKALTGLAALSRQIAASKVMALVGAIAQIPPPEQLGRLDRDVLIEFLARNLSLYVPGLIKTDEQVEADRQADLEAQTQIAAAEKTVDTVGEIAKAQAAPQQGAA